MRRNGKRDRFLCARYRVTGPWISDTGVKKLDKASDPFVKLGDQLKSNQHAKKVFIPVGQAARKLEYKLDIYFETDLWKKKQAEMMYHNITVPTSEALIYGSTVCSHTVAFLFYWNLFWEWF